MKLDDLVTQLRTAYADAVRSIVLYGSAVAGEHHAKRSDYNVLVIVREIPFGRAHELAAATRAWKEAGNPPPMTFTEDEWRSSADVFPMEYADILERHRVLWGEPPFAGVVVHPADLRLQVEHEALAMVLRLRQGMLLAGTDAEAQRQLFASSLSSFMIVARGVLRLHGRTPSQNYADLTRELSEVAGVPADAILEVVHDARDQQAVPKERAAAVLHAYYGAMEAVARHAHAFPPPRT